MKKNFINNILIGIIVVLCISICFLIFCIAKRPRYVETSEPETAVIAEIPESINTTASSTVNSDLPELPQTNDSKKDDSAKEHMQGKTSTRVNIRDRATEDAKVLDTVDEGTTFEIVEILDNGWTHILYDNTDAYISSAYVIITNE
jgi:Bacterial SH3 domain.